MYLKAKFTAFTTSLSMSFLSKLFHNIGITAGLLCERGWAERNAGNLSVRLSEVPSLPGPRRFILPVKPEFEEGTSLLITAAGARMRDLIRHPEKDIVVLSFHAGQQEAMLYGLPDQQPSSELLTHLLVHQMLYTNHPEETVLLHAHVTELIAMSHHPDICEEQGMNDILLRMHAETLFFLPEGIAYPDFGIPGSMALAETTAGAMMKHKVCIWPKHGALASGPNIQEAFDRLDIVAKAARIWLQCKAAGFVPAGLSQDEMTQLKAAYFPHQFTAF